MLQSMHSCKTCLNVWSWLILIDKEGKRCVVWSRTRQQQDIHVRYVYNKQKGKGYGFKVFILRSWIWCPLSAALYTLSVVCQNKTWHYSIVSFYYIFLAFDFFSILRGHLFFSSPPQRPMTSDFEGFLYQILSITLFSYLNSWERASDCFIKKMYNYYDSILLHLLIY